LSSAEGDIISDLDRRIECRLVDRGARMANDARLWEHFRKVLDALGIDASQDAMDAMLAGAVDAMLFDDATENRSRAPFVWGKHSWREGFFEKHWAEIRAK